MSLLCFCLQNVDAEILSLKNDGLDVRLLTGLKAFVKKEHLSDFKCNYSGFMFLCQAAKDHMKNMQDLVYIGEQRKRQIVSFQARRQLPLLFI